ncbi:MAG: hypothetical protein ACRDJ3_12270, partial [Solirubrobacteraceae bacterium]
EQGCARIFGRSQRAQAQLIIEHAAHSDAREQLYEHAATLAHSTREPLRVSGPETPGELGHAYSAGGHTKTGHGAT